jgi:nitrogen regulatory protein PII
MKKIEAIIRPEKLDKLMEKLEELGYSGVTVSDVEGHGRQKGMKEIFRGREYDIKFIPKRKVEIVVKDEMTEKIIDAIIQVASTGQVGDGKIFVTPVLDVIRVRTKERGESAV